MTELQPDMAPVAEEKPGFLRACTARAPGRCLILLAGIILGQATLYGPSLIGRRILLPVDILAAPTIYLPQTPENAKVIPHDPILSDLVFEFEPARRFAVSELHAGRFPLWATYQYAGSPFIWPKFSPFLLFECLSASPVILAWGQLLTALVAGVGFYFFCRRALGVGFWAAVIPAWCYPMTGFFIFWQGFATSLAVYWLPWLLLAVDRTVRGAGVAAPIGLSAVTGLTLVSGHIDLAGQVLLVSGLYALWCLLDAYPKPWLQRAAYKAALVLTVGWGLGFMLASPHFAPLLEYARTGIRMERRSAGDEERPPIGLAALPQVVLPRNFGATQYGSFPMFPKGQGNLPESASGAYAGLLATLFVAPLAWCNQRRRFINLFWVLLGFFGLSWCLDVPGIVQLLRLPGLNMMSHNRLVFATAFATLALAAIGLDVLEKGQLQRRWWFVLPAALLVSLCAWCFYRAANLPEPIATRLGEFVQQGRSVIWIRTLADVHQVQAWFIRAYTVGALLCGLGVLAWVLLWLRTHSGGWRPWMVPALGVVMVGDMLWFAWGRAPQCDPALYYPPLPMLRQIAQSTPGRVLGYHCLPATLAQAGNLRDIRGYDSIDPARLMGLLATAAVPKSMELSYAMSQWFVPRADLQPPDSIRLPPVLDLLGVRYVIFRGSPQPELHPRFQAFDYWALVNSNALPRAFVTRRVEVVADNAERLGKMAAPDFDPRAVAYLESPVTLPDDCRGTAEITAEIPTRVTLALKMETAGLVVLADLWDKGWRAYLNGQPVPILRADNAVRGVVVPAGNTTLEFRYQPASLAWGLRAAALAAVLLIAWSVIPRLTRRPPSTVAAQ